jgi:lysophospholipid acyltransferase (LPLAT)-like uncharacterized protein
MMKQALKRFSRSQNVQRAISWLAAQFMKFVFKTNRWEYLYRERMDPYWQNKRPVIACFWHNRLGMMFYAWLSDTPFHMLISGHSDGKFISATISHLGVQTIAGSTSKGSSDAIRKVLRVLKKGESVGVTPDGPRGPRFSINQGLVHLASKAGVDLVPATYSTTRRIVFNSWDRLILPLPFGRGVLIYGEPIPMHPNQTEEELLMAGELLQQRLLAISNQADQLCGKDIIPTIELEKKMVR